ncbi:MAG: leucine-rich repeat protein [Clostridia bacterium]|nr:leucine-rich repeat protein [Clostridia bacterium]
MKKLIASIMVVVMVITAAPFSGFAGLDLPELFSISASAESPTHGSCGFNLEWDFDEFSGELLINGTGNMDDYSVYGGQPWSDYNMSIKTLIIAGGIKSIGSFAFYDCTALKDVYYYGDIADWCSITFAGMSSHPMINAENLYINGTLVKGDIVIPDSVTRILDYAFYNCAELTSVTFSEGVSSLGWFSFYECDGLKSITIPKSLTYIGESAFEKCKGITEVKYNGTEEEWGNVFVDWGNDELLKATISFAPPAHECVYGEWTVIAEPTATETGTKTHVCTICGEAETVTISATGFETAEGITIDFASNTVSGINAGESSLEKYLVPVDESYTWEYETTNDRLGTGSKAFLKDGDTVIGEYTILVYGDTTGDSWYDGQDAVLVSCLANDMLTEAGVGEAVYMAADCNHDGVIDDLDVALLNEAGTLLTEVDQSKSAEVLLETSTAYVEYLELVDQSPELDVEKEKAEMSIFDFIVSFIKLIIEMLFSYIPVPYK